MTMKERLLSLDAKGEHVDLDTYFKIQKLLNREAYLINHEQLDEWCDMLAEDLVYWAPIRENIMRRNKTPEILPNRMAFFDETKVSIMKRMIRNDSGMCWTEDPPTRNVTAISNIEAYHLDDSDELEVHSVFTLYRSRFERDDSTLMGRRKDIWRRSGDNYQLIGRLIMLQQSTLLTKNLNIFM